MKVAMATRLAAFLLGGLFAADWAFGNGGPFVVKYPSGDPAAKGVLARLEPDLKPACETRLRVRKEDLSIKFDFGWESNASPLASVKAEYVIENPTDSAIKVDFGFPILRGIHVQHPMVGSRPIVRVAVRPVSTAAARPPRSYSASQRHDEELPLTVISNSVIFGIIRSQSHAVIEKGIFADRRLRSLVAKVRMARPARSAVTALPEALSSEIAKPRRAPPVGPMPGDKTRAELADFLTKDLQWTAPDAALLVEYASLDFGEPKSEPLDRWNTWTRSPEGLRDDATANRVMAAYLGPLSAIGEQKATQLFTRLAARFDKDAPLAYEAIFKAWGGDVRERAVDLDSGEVRLREIDLPPAKPDVPEIITGDGTIYARVDYLDPKAKITEAERQACENILKNLPVTFTFAPMNLLHYEVDFPARAARVVTVSYSQHAYLDTKGRPSYQLAYVLHPATLWKEFGPIHVQVELPKGIPCRASTPMVETRKTTHIDSSFEREAGVAVHQVYEFTLSKAQEKSGELMVGLDKTEWDKIAKRYAKVEFKHRNDEDK